MERNRRKWARPAVWVLVVCMVLTAMPLCASAMEYRGLGYDKVNQAIEWAQAGDTVTLTGSITTLTKTIVIPSGKNMVLNLGTYMISDRRLTNAAGTAVYIDMKNTPLIQVNSGATLTIKGTGTIVNHSEDGIGIINNGTLSLDGVKVQVTGEGAIAVQNNGTLQFKSGTIQADAKEDTAVRNTGTAAMSGGEVIVQTSDAGTAVVNSGTFTMSSGTMNCKSKNGIGIKNAGGKVSFTGGTITVAGTGACGIYNASGTILANKGTVLCTGMNSMKTYGIGGTTGGGVSSSNDGSIIVKPTASVVYINGKATSFDAYYINGNNYFKLRDLASVLSGTAKQFEVTWSQEMRSISLTTGTTYTPVGGEMAAKGTASAKAYASSHAVYLNKVKQSFAAYTINSNNYFKLRDIGKALDFSVTWKAANNAIYINTGMAYTAN